MPPPNGDYYIKNRASEYYLFSKDKEPSGALVLTDKVTGDLKPGNVKHSTSLSPSHFADRSE